MKILIVDDSIDKLSEVSKLLIESVDDVVIDTVEDIQGAMNFLSENKVDLLILDQFLPLRDGKNGEIIENGGHYLLNEINRKASSINTPKYIIGLTQYYNNSIEFSNIWQIIEYSPTHSNWCNPIVNMLNHISNVQHRDEDEKIEEEVLPTIFLEGKTDLMILARVVELYFSEISDKFILRSQKNAGANWVAQQLVIWGHQLKRDSDNNLIRAIGLFDSDEAGIRAKNDAFKKLTTGNQQNATKTLTIEPKFCDNVLEFYKNGLQIEFELENLLPLEIIQYAESQDWLENRNPLFVKPPKEMNPMSETVPEFLDRIGLSNDLKVYLKKVKVSNKKDFAKYVVEQSQTSTKILDGLKELVEYLLIELAIISK